MAPIHATLAAGRWQLLTLAQQLGNIGSEFARFCRARERGQTAADPAAFRLLELLDLTIADQRWRRRLKELTRLREVFCNLWLEAGAYQVTPADLEAYFTAFALRARASA